MDNISTAKEPQIYLLSRPTFDLDAFLAFLRAEDLTWRRTPGATSAEEIVEASGRICYLSFGDSQSPRDNLQYIRNLIRMGHDSVLEHVAWTVLIAGVSRALTHQLVRHRIGFAYSQLSQQYHDEKDATFIVPPGLETIPEAMQAWNEAITSARHAYTKIVDALESRQSGKHANSTRKETQRAIRSAARSVLPQATETMVMVTANARAFRHVLVTRGSIPGDVEMRRVCAALLRVLKPEAPSLFFDFDIQTLPDNSPTVVQVAEETTTFAS